MDTSRFFATFPVLTVGVVFFDDLVFRVVSPFTRIGLESPA
jgi:hypothetical protein